VLGNAAVTLGASGITLALLNVASILIVRMIGVEGRGEVAAAVLIPTILAYGGWCGLPAATGYWVNAKPRERDRVIASARTLAALISFALTSVCLVVVYFFPLHDTIRAASLVFALFIPLNLFVGVHQAVLQADLQSNTYNLIRIAGALLYVIFLAILDLTGHASPLTVVVAQLVGNIAWFVLSMFFARSSPWFVFSRSDMRGLLAYGARAHLGSMSPIDGLRIDQLILGLFLTSYDLGLYVIAMTFVTANRMIGQSLGIVAFPLASRNWGEHQARKRLMLGGLVFSSLVITLIVVGIEILLGRQLLRVLFNVESGESYKLLVILTIGSVFMCTRQVTADVLRGLGRPSIPTIAELTSLVALCALAFAFWDKGLVGIAYGVSVSGLLALLVVLYLGFGPRTNVGSHLRRILGWPLRWHPASITRAGVFLAVLAAAGSSGLLFPRISVQSSVALTVFGVIALGCVFVAIAFGLQGVTLLAMAAMAMTVGMNGVRVSTSVAFSDLFYFAAALTLIVPFLRASSKELQPIYPLIRGFLLVLAGGLVGSLVAGDPVASLDRLLRFMLAAALMPIFFALWRPTLTQIKVVSWLWVLSATANAFVAMVETANPYNHRSDGLTTHPNHLALVSILAIGPAVALSLMGRRLTSLIGISCCGLLGMGVLVSGSRAGMIGLVAVIISIAAFTRRKEVLVGVCLAGIAGFVLVTTSTISLPNGNALNRILGGGDTTTIQGVSFSDTERQEALHSSLGRAMEHPITGAGFEDALAAHNVFLQMWSSAGLLGLVGIVLVFAAVLEPSVRLFIRSRGPFRDRSDLILLGFSASFIGYFSTSVFQPALWDRYIWLGPSVIGAIVLQSQHLRALKPVETEKHQPLPGASPRLARRRAELRA
jgi:O-antigen/teichoic acid export membrane protein/O-antigen ligase